MTNANFTALLRHEELPEWLRTALDHEVQCGLGKDSKLLLAAAVEGLLATVCDVYRVTVLDPLTAARLLAKDALISKALWKPAEKDQLIGKVETETDLLTLLENWTRARAAYRRRERNAAASKVRFADGRPVDLRTLKAA